MLISDEFDKYNKDRRERIHRNAQRTADKLNARLKNFLTDIEKNLSLTGSQKKEIRERVLQNL